MPAPYYRRPPRWSDYAPLAAAVAVGLLALLVLGPLVDRSIDLGACAALRGWSACL